jgi:hypothetical protein
MALQAAPAPRDEQIVQHLARLNAPWWGLAAWGAVYAMTVMAFAAVFATGAVEWVAVHVFSLEVEDQWGMLFWIALALTAPITILPLRSWVRRRLGGLVEVARHGELTAGQISAATVVSARSAFGRSAHSCHLTVTTALGVFEGYVAKQPSWVVLGRSVEVVALPHSGFAIAAQCGSCFGCCSNKVALSSITPACRYDRKPPSLIATRYCAPWPRTRSRARSARQTLGGKP